MTDAPLLDYITRYPSHPGSKRRDTSHEAADAIAGRAPKLRKLVLEALQKRPMTADEVASELSLTVLQTRPRLSELASRDKIIDTGERRRNDSGKQAIVWRVSI